MTYKKGEPGGDCARKACDNGPAVGFNRSTGLWYCGRCSALINEENRENSRRLYGVDDLVILPEVFKNDG